MKKSLILLLLIMSTSAHLVAEPIQISVSTLQLEQKPETYVISAIEWGDTVNSLHNRLKSYLYKKADLQQRSQLHKIGVLIPLTYLEFHLSKASFTAIHEVGHAQSALAFGLQPSLGHGDIENLSTWQLYYYNIVQPSKRSFTRHKNPNEVTITAKQNAQITGNGINANTLYAQHLNHKSLRYNRYNHLESMDIVLNKIGGAGYFLSNTGGKDLVGDPNQYVGYLKDQGINTSVEKINTLMWASTLLSGSTINSFMANRNFIQTGNETTEPLHLTIKNTTVYLPEWMVYLNGDNVSLASECLFRYKKLPLIGITLEKNIIGNNTPFEFTGSIQNKHDNIEYSTSLTLNSAGNFYSKTVFIQELSEDLDVYTKLFLGNGKTLAQTREFPFTSNGVSLGARITL